MDVLSINQQLRVAYQVYLDQIYNQDYWKGEGVSAPLLMHVFDDYAWMEKKILFVGQETHGWDWIEKRLPMEALLKKYTDFDLGKCADYGDSKPPRYLRSSFWNFCRSFFYQLNQTSLGVTRKTNGFLWTNISKFDSNSTTPGFDLQQQNEAGFELLKQEITIVQPDVVVFLIGHKYDYWLKKLFRPTCKPILDDRSLCMLHDSTQTLPLLSFKTKHPRTLCMEKTYRAVLAKMVEVALK